MPKGDFHEKSPFFTPIFSDKRAEKGLGRSLHVVYNSLLYVLYKKVLVSTTVYSLLAFSALGALSGINDNLGITIKISPPS
jgi:hypothetical protein